jgi:NADH-quinone oxidoreductase subunit M
LAALVQKDFKFVVGYSSVSHMGFVLLGLMTLSTIGLTGAVLQMFSHGVIAGLLFAVVGRMVYDRTHTRDFSELGSLDLNRALPWAAVVFILAGLASMGMPGFSGFVAELQVLVGAWRAFPAYAILTGVGILIGVAYTLRAVQKGFFSAEATPLPRNSAENGSASAHQALSTISFPERIGAVFLLAVSLLIGLYPRLLLDVIIPSFNAPMFEGLRKVGPG